MSAEKAIWQQKIERLLWPEQRDTEAKQSFLLALLRLIYVSIIDLMEGQLSLRAMSLVYTTLLSIVPLLALSFSVLKAMGAHNEIEPFLFQFLAPLGPQGVDIGESIIGFIENIKVGVLGSVGLGLLIYTVLSLVQKIENAFNMIWRVDTTRGIGERFSNYLSVILIGPVIMVSALGMTATVMSSSFVEYFLAIEPFGSLIVMLTKLLPYLMVMGVFTFFYMFVPNTRVRFGAAVIAGIVSGFLWETSGVLFATFVVNSTKYTAIYSSFAVVIMLLIWLYISWLILLFGSNLAFYLQNPSSMRLAREGVEMSSRVKERLALRLMQVIAQRYRAAKPAPNLAELESELALAEPLLCHIIDKLLSQQLLVETNAEPLAYLPARSLDSLLLLDIVRAVREAEEVSSLTAGSIALPDDCLAIVDAMELGMASALQGKTLADLLSPNAA